jgi:hypothetical protein
MGDWPGGAGSAVLLCRPERSCRSRSERQRSRRIPNTLELPMASEGVLSEQFEVVVETPFKVGAAAGGCGILRLRGCFAKREAATPLRMTGVREFRASGAALPRRCWSRWLGVAFGFWPPRMRRGIRWLWLAPWV